MCLCAELIVARATIVTDITAFLPGPATREQAMLAEQLRDGVAARVILIGIEAASAEQTEAAAKRSQQIAATLRADPRFAFVANGDPAMFAAERDRLFDARYLLSAQVTPQRFSVEGLRAAANELEALLRSSAAPLIKPTAARDLTGELLSVAAALKPARAPVSAHGVWFDSTGRTALLLATTRAPGFDVDAQAEAVAAIRAAFGTVRRAEPPQLQLHLTGPGVFAVESRRAIQHDARRLTLIATVAVSLLLLIVLRSPRFLLWAALPTATGALAGLAAVSVAFGSIHGITLGFGLTLVGEAVDYAVYVQVQRQHAEQHLFVEGLMARRADIERGLRRNDAVGICRTDAAWPDVDRRHRRRGVGRTLLLARRAAAARRVAPCALRTARSLFEDRVALARSASGRSVSRRLCC